MYCLQYVAKTKELILLFQYYVSWTHWMQAWFSYDLLGLKMLSFHSFMDTQIPCSYSAGEVACFVHFPLLPFLHFHSSCYHCLSLSPWAFLCVSSCCWDGNAHVFQPFPSDLPNGSPNAVKRNNLSTLYFIASCTASTLKNNPPSKWF